MDRPGRDGRRSEDCGRVSDGQDWDSLGLFFLGGGFYLLLTQLTGLTVFSK